MRFFPFVFDHTSMRSASMKYFIETFHAGKGGHFPKSVPKYFFWMENTKWHLVQLFTHKLTYDAVSCPEGKLLYWCSTDLPVVFYTQGSLLALYSSTLTRIKMVYIPNMSEWVIISSFTHLKANYPTILYTVKETYWFEQMETIWICYLARVKMIKSHFDLAHAVKS